MATLFKTFTTVTLLFIISACSSEPEMEIPEDIAAMENVAIYSGDEEPKYDISFSKKPYLEIRMRYLYGPYRVLPWMIAEISFWPITEKP